MLIKLRVIRLSEPFASQLAFSPKGREKAPLSTHAGPPGCSPCGCGDLEKKIIPQKRFSQKRESTKEKSLRLPAVVGSRVNLGRLRPAPAPARTSSLLAYSRQGMGSAGGSLGIIVALGTCTRLHLAAWALPSGSAPDCRDFHAWASPGGRAVGIVETSEHGRLRCICFF